MLMQGSNPGADPLRDVLTRYGSSVASTLPPPQQQAPGYAPPYPSYQPQGMPPPAAPPGDGYLTPPSSGRAPMQEQSLPPPGR